MYLYLSLSNSSIAQVLKNIENNYFKFWQGEITASKKLDFYRKFKQDFSVSSYIDILRNRGTRKSFVKFYLSNHKLCIESGRHRRLVLPREERICAVCKNNEIEDEAHMLFSCTLYNTLREQFLIKQQHILNTAFDNYDYWLNILFTTENKAFSLSLSLSLSLCLSLSVSLCLSVPLSLSVSVSVCLSVCLSVSVYLSVSVLSVSVSLSVSLS